ncbi:MAG: SRPBCC family protein [Gemmatimonadaceae bacterium]
MTSPYPAPRTLPELPPSLLGTLAGSALVAIGARRRGASGAAVGVAGAALLALNLPSLAGALVEAGARRYEVALRETLVFDRPIAELFAFCANFEHFPEIVSSLERVVDFDNGRSRWTLRTPAGRVVEWDAMVTKYLPQQVIAWESVAGSPVRSSGLFRFRALAPDRTLVDVTLRFAPVRVSAVDALASLLAPPRSRRLRTDLARAGGQPLRHAVD